MSFAIAGARCQGPKMPLLTELENLLSDGLLQRWRSERSWGHEPVDVGQARLARHFLRGALARPPGCGQFWAVVRGYRKLNPRLLSGNPPGWRGWPNRRGGRGQAGSGQPTSEDAAPDGAWGVRGLVATKMALLAELGKERADQREVGNCRFEI